MSQSEKSAPDSVARRTVARLRVKKSRLLARAGHTERKRDTRRKILIGGAVLAAIEHEGVPAFEAPRATAVARCAATRAHDRAVFDLPTRQARAESPFGPIRPSGPQRSGGQGCRQGEAPRQRRGASLTAARAKGIVPRAERDRQAASQTDRLVPK